MLSGAVWHANTLHDTEGVYILTTTTVTFRAPLPRTENASDGKFGLSGIRRRLHEA
jgi:hypothetical protein